jgi:polyadenylate-binding protein
MIQSAPVQFQSASLYVGDLHSDIIESALFEIFNRVGPVASIRVCRDNITRRSLGYGYVNFHNVSDAERALDTMNFTEIKGKPCRIMWSQRDPSLRKSGVGNVFVKNLAPSVDNKDLFDTFSGFGNILSCKVANDDKGISKGYGYVHFETAESAQAAIDKLNGMLIEDQVVTVVQFVKRQDRSGDWTNLYVKQFPESWDEAKLKELFAEFGEIANVVISRDETGKSKRFGFVNFVEHASAEEASKLSGKTFEDPTGSFELYVNRAQKSEERKREISKRRDQMRVERNTKFQGMNLYVKNVDDEVTDEAYKEAFAPFGTIISARIMRTEAGLSRGFGFICYSSAEEAGRALAEMNGKPLKGKPLTVTLHQRLEVRRAHLAQTMGPRPRYPMPSGPMGYPMMPYMNQMRGPGGFPMMHNMMGPRPPRGGMAGNNYRGAGSGAGGVYPIPYGIPGMGGVPSPKSLQRAGMPHGPGQVGPQMGQPGQPQGPGMQRGRAAPGVARTPRGGHMQMQGQPGQPISAPRAKNLNYTAQARNQPPHMGMPPQHMMPNQPQPQVPLPSGGDTIDAMMLQQFTQADPQTQKNMIGERLYPLIAMHQPELAGKITGMLLEMDNAELLHLLESPEALQSKIEEALTVLRAHNQAE